MKPHLIIKFNRALRDISCGHWQPLVTDKSGAVERIRSDVDRVFDEHAAPFWVTLEYPPANGRNYVQDEIDAGFDRTYRFILRTRLGIPAGLVSRIRLIPDVESAREIEATSAMLPDRLSESSSLRRHESWATEMIGLKQAHLQTDGHRDIKIAVLDTGIDSDHPELAGKIVDSADFVDFEGLETTSFIGDLLGADRDAEDEVGHGTHVAGIVGAKGIEIPQGVCPGCSQIAVRVLATLNQGNQRVGAGLIDNINVGIKWAVDQGADVINMSLGIRHEQGGLPHEDVIKYAIRKGTTVVAASGNDGSNNKYYPGALPGVIAVGAVDPDRRVADFTSFGARISFLAPGTAILSSYRSGGYVASSGTSQAAPFVSGAVGLLKSFAMKMGRRLGDNSIKYILKNSSDRLTSHWHNNRSGYGIINLADAITLTRHSLNT